MLSIGNFHIIHNINGVIGYVEKVTISQFMGLLVCDVVTSHKITVGTQIGFITTTTTYGIDDIDMQSIYVRDL